LRPRREAAGSKRQTFDFESDFKKFENMESADVVIGLTALAQEPRPARFRPHVRVSVEYLDESTRLYPTLLAA